MSRRISWPDNPCESRLKSAWFLLLFICFSLLLIKRQQQRHSNWPRKNSWTNHPNESILISTCFFFFSPASLRLARGGNNTEIATCLERTVEQIIIPTNLCYFLPAYSWLIFTCFSLPFTNRNNIKIAKRLLRSAEQLSLRIYVNFYLYLFFLSV